jgi:hypothetical protein
MLVTSKIICEPSFNPVGHIYEMPDGRRLDSVTQILKAELGLWKYGTCDAAERGTRVHLACQYLDENRLDCETVSEIDAPYVKTYEKFKAETDYKVLACELRRYHPVYLYAGTIDRLCEIDGKPVLLDLKTGAPEHSYQWQLAAYLKLIESESRRKWRRACLYIKPEGSKLVYHDGASDWTEYLALYSAHNVKKSYGYWKPEKEKYDPHNDN